MRGWFAVFLVACVGCHAANPGSPAPAAPVLLPVALPDLTRVDESVRAQAREHYAAVTQKQNAPASERAVAFGKLGMLLHATEYYQAAEPCYLNAQTLAPDDLRWPYYMGHLYKGKGETAKAEAAFARALEIKPDDVASLVWLGRLYLDDGQPDRAEPLFARAQQQAPRAPAVLGGLGQAALARRDYQLAANRFEEALAADPSAESLHSPLAAAYRGLGRIADAEAHLKQWRNTDLLVPDPVKSELDILVESGLSYELRGVRALESGDPQAAIRFLRRGIELTPENSALARSLHHKLGTALFLTGQMDDGVVQFNTVVKMAPAEGIDESSAKAHYSLGLIMATNNRRAEALQHLAAAVKYQPNYAEARLAYGDALRRAGRFEPALTQYAETVRINPRSTEARFGYAISLVRLNRFREARDWLDESVRLQPDKPELAHALARILATAPDPAIRDGRRAIAIVEELLKGEKTTALGATMAMTLAEVGEFDQAAAIQRGVIDAARRAGLSDDVRRLTEDLRLYERKQPCRTPWKNDDPVNLPGPPSSVGTN